MSSQRDEAQIRAFSERFSVERRLVILSVFIAVVGGGVAYLFLRIDLIPRPASVERQSIDSLLQLLFSIAAVIFVLVMAFFVHALVFSRRRRRSYEEGPPLTGIGGLEIAWTIVPLFIVVAIGVYGGIVLNRMTAPPANAQTEVQVNVLAFRWGWQFTYPEYGFRSFQLSLPVDRPVIFNIESRDVVHSFWVPEFGPKQDAVPGKPTTLRLTPTKTGQYQVLCAELCGMGHTIMTAPAVVFSAADFDSWVKQQQAAATPTPTPTSSPSPAPPNTANLAARNLEFNLSAITVSAGAQVTIHFDNQDDVPHNFALYTDGSAQTVIFRGDIINRGTTTYTFTAPAAPGDYFFRCDVHPMTMTGTFTVK